MPLPVIARLGIVLAAWALLAGAVYAAAAAAGVREVRLRRCMALAVPPVALVAAWFTPVTNGLSEELALAMAVGLGILLVVGTRYLLRTTWLRALATLAVTCLYGSTLVAIVWRLTS